MGHGLQKEKDTQLSIKKILIIVGAVAVVVLVLLAVFAQGRVQGIALGLLFIVAFVGVFGGLILGINFIQDRYFVRPRNPTHVCPSCYQLEENPEEPVCMYCAETFGLQKTLEPLDEFLENHPPNDIRDRLKKLEIDLKTARGRNILFIEHDMKNLRRIGRIHEERLRKSA